MGPGDVDVVFDLIVELAEYERSRDQVTSSSADLTAALFGEGPSVFGHVVEHDGAVVGFALWFLNFSTWAGKHGIYLEDLYVRPQFRGHGYGRALLAELARICTERGYARLEWWVLDWNEPALGFYRQLGAVPMDEWTVHRLTGAPLDRLGNRPGTTRAVRGDGGATALG
jgi:GNAT superfamily N-acetyltransferase